VKRIVRPGFFRSLAASWRSKSVIVSREARKKPYSDAQRSTGSPADRAYETIRTRLFCANEEGSPHRVWTTHVAVEGKGTLTIPKAEVPVSAKMRSTTMNQTTSVRLEGGRTVLLEELAHPRPQPGMLDRALHILLGNGFRLVPLLLAGINDLLPLDGLRAAHFLDGRGEGLGEERDDAADVGGGVDGVADLGFERMEFDGFLDVEVKRKASRAVGALVVEIGRAGGRT
jgi:hypothetical protein